MRMSKAQTRKCYEGSALAMESFSVKDSSFVTDSFCDEWNTVDVET